MPEWSKGELSKSSVSLAGPGVRIPLPPFNSYPEKKLGCGQVPTRALFVCIPAHSETQRTI